jgi:hypothetical protein
MYSSSDGKQWNKIADLTNEKRDRPNAYIELEKPVKAKYIKYEHVYCAAPNLAISDIRVFGSAPGKPPTVPAKFNVKRDVDPRNAFVSWEKVRGATGYNILWGIAKDKLYQTYQIFGDEPSMKEIRALSTGVTYYFAIEAFNESGVSQKCNAIEVK